MEEDRGARDGLPELPGAAARHPSAKRTARTASSRGLDIEIRPKIDENSIESPKIAIASIGFLMVSC